MNILPSMISSRRGHVIESILQSIQARKKRTWQSIVAVNSSGTSSLFPFKVSYVSFQRFSTNSTDDRTTHSTSSSMKDVVALVTGGCSGLGSGAAQALVNAGATVIVTDLIHQQSLYEQWVQNMLLPSSNVQLLQVKNDKDSNSTSHSQHPTNSSSSSSSSSLEYTKGSITFLEMDVTKTDQVTDTFSKIEEMYGLIPNVVVNCAGIGKARKTISIKKDESKNTDNNTRSTSTTIRVHPINEFIQTLNVNTIGTFNVSTIAAERMCRQQQQQHEQTNESNNSKRNYCIIHTASIAGYEGQVGQVAYAASKGAIIAMTLPMARDLSTYNIRVMTIAPGLFDTPLVQQLPKKVQDQLGLLVPYPNRLGAIAEYGQLVLHIIQNQYLNGSVIRLDGALRMPP
jgi:3-hydroxyacyl-CoA dehydrogenase / 3-hydroxy-2-methylbutyryl-CoA dehydrogenase